MITISVVELEEREKKLEEEIRDKQELLEALRKTRTYIQTGGKNGVNDPAMERTVKTLKSSAPRYGQNTRLVRNAIKQTARNYTIRDIRRILTNGGTPLSDQSIATVLNRLKKNRDIVELRKGKGRRPSLFKKV